MADPDLFDEFEQRRRTTAARDAQVTEPAEGRVSRDPAVTSALAARTVGPKTGTQRGRVLAFVVERGSATDFEITRGCGLLDSSTRPRRGELVAQDFLEDSGKTREHQGSRWTVWTPTADALAWYRRTQLGGAA